MKKIFLLVIFIIGLFSFNNITLATDACDKFIPVNQNFYGKANMVARFRDYPCVNKSKIIGASKIGEIYKIVRKVDGWYEIQFNDGNTTWIWDQAITKMYDYVSDSSTNNTSNENVVNNGYLLSNNDKIIINKIIFQVNLLIDKKGFTYKDVFLSKLESVVSNYTLSPRLDAIFNELIVRTKNIQEKTEEEKVENIINTTIVPKSTQNDLSDYNIDFDKVKKVWLGRNNLERAKLGKYAYNYNLTLEKTAFDWSQTLKTRGNISHKRNTGDSYYDYNKITNWFKDRGVVCKNIYRVTHTENIGWGTFSCNDGECSDELIDGIRSTFDFYMSEKNKSYKAHYLSLMNDYFKEIGLGIAIEKNNDYYKYYLTVHYCTELVE